MDSSAATAAGGVYKSVCIEMSNSHLLKLDTHDTYATANALRKLIATTCPPPLTGDVEKGEPLFPGMVRCSKNPKAPNIFFSFDSAEAREHAKNVLTTHMKHRKHQPWVDVPVTEKDLQMTYRGAANNNENTAGANASASSPTTAASENPGSLSNKAIKRQVREGDERTSNTAQWAAYPYAVQVSKKASHCKSIIRQIASGRLQRQLSTYNCQQLLENFSMIESPCLSGYRNHVNFTCGYDAQHRPVMGFMSGSVTSGSIAVEDVTGRWYNPTSETDNKNGAPLVPLTTNTISVAYAKAVMEVVKQFEDYHAPDGKQYQLGMLDKGAQATVSSPTTDGNGEELINNSAANEEEPQAKRAARAEEAASASSVVVHPFWRRVQVRHNTVGEVMVDLEVDPSVLPTEVVTAIRNALISSLTTVEKSFDGAVEEEKENKFAASMSATESVLASGAFAAAANSTTLAISEEKEAAKPDSHRLVSAIKRPKPLVIPTCKLVSLQWHFHGGSTMCPHEAPREIIFGNGTLVENLCGMKFLLSPPSFFQVNTPTTEKMLERVAEVAQLKPTTTLLDLCCGTGIIGICLSKFVKKIVGIEMVVSAVENAKVNAANNGVSEKTTYYAAKVEDALNMAMSTMTPAEKEDIVAIFDPPRAGMHPSVLAAVRGFPQIRRIVYISCDQQALVRDCPSLMKEPTKKFRGTPYVIEGTFGIDLFPHTPHVEMVAVLSKVSNEAMAKYYDTESKYRVKEVAGGDDTKPEEEEMAENNAAAAVSSPTDEEPSA